MEKFTSVACALALGSLPALSSCSENDDEPMAWSLRESINSCVVDITDNEGVLEPEMRDYYDYNHSILIDAKSVFEGFEGCECKVGNITGVIDSSDNSINTMDIVVSRSYLYQDSLRSLSSGTHSFDVDLAYSIDNDFLSGVELSIDTVRLKFDLLEGNEVVLNNQFTINLSESSSECGFYNSEGMVVDSFTSERDYIFR